MKWGRNEIERLHPIPEQISADLSPVDGKKILVLCSSTGELVFWLAEMMEQGKVTGIELDQETLGIAQRAAHEMGLEGMVEFIPGEMNRIPLPDAIFDALVSEFIVYPTSMPTRIGQPEMARLLKPGGKLILTDVIAIHPLPPEIREELEMIGMDYVCEGTQLDFQSWMAKAGLVNIELRDLTPTLRAVWEDRRVSDLSVSHSQGYSYLLDHPRYGLGKTIFYIYVRGEKPKSGG